jgi:excinuclease ABC subunit C
MDLHQKIRTLPTKPGVYMYKNADGQVIYVGKAKSLRARVRNYFVDRALEDAKTGSLIREAVDVEYIVVENEKEALALENNLIKQKKPRFNILLRDDKSYPSIKLTVQERWPRVYVTRRLRKDGALYFGPFFPANLAYRIVDVIHRHFKVPSCTVDLNRAHARPCLQYYIGRCLGPCVEGLTNKEAYDEAVRDARMFLEGRSGDLIKSLTERMLHAAEQQHYEGAAKYRDLISTVTEHAERQRIAATEGDDADVYGFHYENDMLAVNIFHLRGGKIVDRREMFWEDLHKQVSALDEQGRFSPAEFFSTLLQQLYLDANYVPRAIYIPLDFDDREALEELLSEKGRRVHIIPAQRGEKRSLLDLAGQNAKQSYDQRFRTMKPTGKIIAEALQDVLDLPILPRRIECFDISHIQGAETVASMVVWEDGKMKKADYRKYIIRDVVGVDDFASMREVVTRRYKRILENSRAGAMSPLTGAVSGRDDVLPVLSGVPLVNGEEGGDAAGEGDARADGSADRAAAAAMDRKEPSEMPSLILIDGGLGQLHAAQEALEALGIINQPLASIAKREEIIYVAGQESDPVALDHHSPVLHLVQMIRDEAHRFAVTFHRKRREIRDRSTELLNIPGVGETTTRRLLQHFGSLQAVRNADVRALTAVVTRSQAEAIQEYFRQNEKAAL